MMDRASTSSRPRVAVIGGGATGCSVARDLALRGFAATLVEFDDLGSGSSSRFHGMLQSGARYAVSDPDYAAECMRERKIVARIAPSTVEATGGLFVSLAEDPPDFADRFVIGCAQAHIPCEELDPGKVMDEEPVISRNVQRAFAVPDATVHPWRLVNLLCDDVRRHGGTVLTRHQVSAITVTNGAACGLKIAGDGREHELEVDAIVNAAGPWSARVAAMADQNIDLQLTKGSIIVLAHRLVTRAVNRCRPPSSHDIIVPTGNVSLFGTTSEVVDDPDTTYVRPEEIQALLQGAEPLIPGIRSFGGLRAWAGVRPLVRPEQWSGDAPLPRRHQVIDHGNHGIDGFFSVCGGSLSTHRSMAEDVVDRVCRHFRLNVPCETASTPIDPRLPDRWGPGAGYQPAVSESALGEIVCDCEMVTKADIETLLHDPVIKDPHDLRRRLGVGFGSCQGTFCGCRLAELMMGMPDALPVEDTLGHFWTERLKGGVKTAWGEQAKQLLVSDSVYRETLGIRLREPILPKEERR